MNTLVPLVFFVTALLAVGAMVGSVLRYRDSVFANLTASHDIAGSRDVTFRVIEFNDRGGEFGEGSLAGLLVGNVHRFGQRNCRQLTATPVDWRAAA